MAKTIREELKDSYLAARSSMYSRLLAEQSILRSSICQDLHFCLQKMKTN